jgi:hypothetical protein
MRDRGLTAFVVVLLLSLAAFGVTPQFWENFSQEDLLKGTFSCVSLSWDGKLFLAPAYDLVFDTQQPFIFSMVRDKAGNLYLGTGHEGKVFKVDPQGNGTLYYQAKELDVLALALDSADVLYVGTSPDGKVYKVTGPNQATEYCNPEDKYIWSMLFDDGGNLYVGTGSRGTLLKVDRTGKKSTFYQSGDSHITALAKGSSGSILAGTSPGGLVLEIKPDGKGFTLLDTPMEEVHSLVVDRFGTIYVVSASSRGLQAKPADTKTGADLTPPLSMATIQALSGLSDKSRQGATASVTVTAGDKESSAGAKAAVVAISKDGSSETLYTSREQMIYDLVARDDGTVLASLGGKGRLISIDTTKQVTVVTDTPEEDVTRLVSSGNTVWAAASNRGKLYKLQPQLAQSGTFESKVNDAKTVASWGRISWRAANPGGGAVELSTRTGNTEKPDNTWSAWSSAYTTGAGQAITSPRARYLQWRATFKRGGAATGPADALERVQMAYLQQNLRPQVVSINLLPFGVALQKQPALQASSMGLNVTSSDGQPLNSPRGRDRDKQALPPRQVLQPGAQAFTWKASDDNDDALVYQLYFKGEGESDWKLLEKNLTDSFCTLDSSSLPDGVYTLKVVASDEPSNPYGKFLVGELVSPPFVIANSTPAVEMVSHKLSGRKVDVQFRSRVSTGHIYSAEFSIDGGEWFLVFPVDGIADSPQEDFQFTTPELSIGEHLISLRSTDANGTTGTARLVVRVQ